MTSAEVNDGAVDWDRVGWRRAAACGEAACVEVARVGDAVAVRDGKHPQGVPLVFTPAEWAAFVRGVRQGDFDDLDGSH